jgi:diguanylate cyclase (GGDEF)-like protein
MSSLLVIDDDSLTRTLVADALGAAGFVVNEAPDGTAGLAALAQEVPDLVLLDVMMPGLDGYEVCRQLRANPHTARVPVIMLTGLDDTSSIERAYESGATDFFLKPINTTLLTHRVRYALRSSRALGEAHRHRLSLANAQRIAKLGSWRWQLRSRRFDHSEEFARILGATPKREDVAIDDLLHPVHPADASHVRDALNRALAAGEPCVLVHRIIRNDCSERTVCTQAEVSRDADGIVTELHGTTQDISERVEAEQRIRQLADYDSLTGLPNRQLFSEVVRHGLNGARRRRVCAAILDINLDRFKRINETLGHTLGDQVLREVSRRILESVRSSDLTGVNPGAAPTEAIARMSGDDFAVFLSEIRHADDAAMVAKRLNAVIAERLVIEGQELPIAASIGIAVYPDNGQEVELLLRNAETAMHKAKQHASRYCFFTASMNEHALAKLNIENELRRAIERDELELHYQARVDAARAELVGAEALVRWRHPQRGLVSPGEFIPVAEESGLIVPLTRWVLESACRQISAWRGAGLAVVPISVNFSSHSFREDGLAECVASSIAEFGIEPDLIEGEITESVLMHDVDRAVRLLRALKDMGIGLSVDDFGTGYSSLAYLKRFPIDVLKIDRIFVKDVLTDSYDAAIATTVITLGKTMGRSVVAEGIEEVEQANFLLARGCCLMQGFLFARPVPANDFARTLANGVGRPAGMVPGLPAAWTARRTKPKQENHALSTNAGTLVARTR